MIDVKMSLRRHPHSGSLIVYTISIIILSVRTRGSNHCPHNGVRYEGKCYWVSESKSAWTDANILCHRLYGDNVTLVTIKDEGTNRFVRSLTDATVWIGLHETHGESEWRWVDNTVPGSLRYSNWQPGTSTAGLNTKNCAAMYRRADQWKDVGCKKSYKFVCSELSSAHICSMGGIFFRDRCYWPAPDAMPWGDANQYCQENFDPEARIAVAKDSRTNRFLSRLIYPGIWLGLHDKKDEGVWRWVDNSPLRFSNWRYGEPNNVGHEDCAVLDYENEVWNDQPCGRLGADSAGEFSSVDGDQPSLSYDQFVMKPIINNNRFVCAIPTCYDPTSPIDDDEADSGGSGSGSTPDNIDNGDSTDSNAGPICFQENCQVTCVPGSVCNGTDGECVCVKHFPEMVCDMNDFKIEIIPVAVNVTVGDKISLRCQLNLPAENVYQQTVVWGPALPTGDNRTIITNHLHRGFSLLEIIDVRLTDAKLYTCAVLMTPDHVFSNFITVASAIVTVQDTSDVLMTEVTHVTTTIPGDHVTNVVNSVPTARRTDSSAITEETDNGANTSRSAMSTVNREISDYITTVPKEEKAKTTGSRNKGNDIPDGNTVKGESDNTVNQVNPGPGPSKDKRDDLYPPATNRAKVAIIMLSITVSMLLIALIGLMLKIRQMERANFGMSRLMELNERF